MANTLKTQVREARLDFSLITLSETGMMASTREYEMMRTEDGVQVSLYDGPWNYHEDTDREDCLASRVTGGEDLYEEIALKCGLFGICKWDKFHKSDSRVLDGTSFSFRAKLADGTEITAGGSNAFPPHYGEFTDYLWDMLH